MAARLFLEMLNHANLVAPHPCRVLGVWCRVEGGAQGQGVRGRVWSVECRVSGTRVQGAGCRVQGAGC